MSISKSPSMELQFQLRLGDKYKIMITALAVMRMGCRM